MHPCLKILLLGAVALLAFVVAASANAADTGTFDAVLGNDTRALTALLSAGADPDTRDEMGATPLLYAVAFASAESVRILLDAGADVNATTNGGATALTWAAGDVAKVRLLLGRAADVTARSKDGATALIAAARRGNTEGMRLLLASGSNPKASSGEVTELLRIAYGGHPETLQVLADAGVSFKDLAQAVPSPANFSLANSSAIRELLELGSNPNPRGRFPIVAAAAFQGHMDTARLLLGRGANPNAKGQQDATPLMMAAAAPHLDPAMVRLLIEKGADLDARDKIGRTALDWARLQGDTEVARLLLTAGATAMAPPAAPPPAVEKPGEIRSAIEQALVRLAPTSRVSYETRKCISCHNQSLPLMAMTLAGERGIAAGAEGMAHPIQSIVEVWNGRREDLMLGREVGGGANELTYGLLALAEAHVPPNSATDAAVANLLSTQGGDGSWVFLDTRPPQADNSRIPFTAMAVRGLEVYVRPGQREEVRRSVARALAFLRAASPGSTQDEAFKLLGLVWANASTVERFAQSRRLQELQRSEGGWSQLPTMAPDAYATGQALYALHASGMTPDDPVYRTGVAYLLRTQLEDGTWFVRSRAFGFQPYFESGFPHGADQFISASATAWAAIALAYAP